MVPIPKKKVYVPIDPAPGIPAGIGHRRVVGDHLYLIFLTVFQILLQRHKEVGIAVPLLGGEGAVHEHLGVLIDRLKFQDSGLLPPLLGHGKPFDIDIGAAGKISAGPRCSGILRAFLVQHCVMGKRNGLHSLLPAHGTEQPARVKVLFFHLSAPPQICENASLLVQYTISLRPAMASKSRSRASQLALPFP